MNLPKDTVNMKKLVVAIFALLSLASCGGKKAEPEVVVNPLWGMWVQLEPVMESKCEMLFTEDNKGFVFIADTFYCNIKWRQDSLLKVNFIYKADSITHRTSRKFEMAIKEDTLFLKEPATEGEEQATRKYVRFKD